MSAAIGPGMRVKCVSGDTFTQPAPATGSVWVVDGLKRAGSEHFAFGMWGELGCDYLKLAGWPKRLFRVDFFVPLDGNEDLSVLTGLLDKLPGRVKERA